jgi:hypothetical protein
LQTARGFGGAFVLGMHSFDKLAETYGKEGATNLASLARTKLILSTADKNTAEVCSEFIGSREVRETDEAYSIGASRSRDAATITPRTEIKPLVMPDDIVNLPSLHGYVKFPEGFPAARIKLNWVNYPVIAEPFQRKTDMQMAAYVPKASTEGGEDRVGGDGGPVHVVGESKGIDLAEDKGSASAEPETDQATGIDSREITAADQQADTRADGEAPRKAEEEGQSPRASNSTWKDSLRLSRGATSPERADPSKTAPDQQTGQAAAKGQQGAAKREQQISIEERTGQSFADPSERHHQRPHGPQINPPDPGIEPDDGMDMGM